MAVDEVACLVDLEGFDDEAILATVIDGQRCERACKYALYLGDLLPSLSPCAVMHRY